MKFLLLILFIFHSTLSKSDIDSVFLSKTHNPELKGGFFSGRISRLNSIAKLARVKTDFHNIKFFNKKDKVVFWNDSFPQKKCNGYIEGKSNEYFLMSIPDYDRCIKRMYFTTGVYLYFESRDLAHSISLVRELIEILKKKRIAAQLKKKRLHKNLATYKDRVEVINKRYLSLREKLEIELQKELLLLEEDKEKSFLEFKKAETQLNDIEMKIESYKIENHNLNLERWSLDPSLYIKK